MRTKPQQAMRALYPFRLKVHHDAYAATEVVRDAMERYMEDREWNRLLAYGAERTKALGLTEEDVPRLIAEVRAEKRRENGA